jgi:anti-repressor protein
MSADPIITECPTPDKKQYRSQAEAARWQRSRYVRPGDYKGPLYPYECPSGEHWHMTHYEPDEQKQITAKVETRTARTTGLVAVLNTFDETHEVRHLIVNGEPWFIATDVARALGYRDAHNLIRRIDSEDRGTRPVSTPGGPQEMATINESGLYAAILGSQVPHAQRFKRWVTSVVLPAIRKTGRYDTSMALPDRKTLAQWVVDSETRAEIAESKVAELTPAASAWNELAESTGDYSVADAAKVLSRDPNISTGERRLFHYMSGLRWLFKRDGRWRAYQDQIDIGRLAEKINEPFIRNGEMFAPAPTVRITPKVLAELHKRLGGSGQLALVALS